MGSIHLCNSPVTNLTPCMLSNGGQIEQLPVCWPCRWIVEHWRPVILALTLFEGVSGNPITNEERQLLKESQNNKCDIS